MFIAHAKAVDLSRQTASFEVFTVVFMKIYLFWDLTLFVFLYKYRYFGEAGCLHLQGGQEQVCIASFPIRNKSSRANS